MKLTYKVIVSPQVVAREMGTEVVILELESGTYFGLDSVGARIWRLIGMGKSLPEVCDEMVGKYEVSREVLERDALALVHDLAEKKLVSVE